MEQQEVNSLYIVDPDIDNLNDLISKNDCVVKFSTTWCGPCQAIAPLFHELCSQHPNMKICLIDCETDNGDEISNKYGIKSIPTFLFFKNGELVNRLNNAGGLEAAFTNFD